jgi:TonB family protein
MRRILLVCSVLLAVFAASAFAQDEELVRGVELYQEGKFVEAVDVLEKFVAADAKHWAAWNYLGGSLANLGREKEAIAALKTRTRDRRDFKKDYDKNLTITKKSPATYTDRARRNGIQGDVILKVEFRADGTIGFVIPTQALAYGLTESALDAARKISFKPAEKNGKPVSVIRTVNYNFAIRQRP